MCDADSQVAWSWVRAKVKDGLGMVRVALQSYQALGVQGYRRFVKYEQKRSWKLERAWKSYDKRTCTVIGIAVCKHKSMRKGLTQGA